MYTIDQKKIAELIMNRTKSFQFIGSIQISSI